MTITLKSGHLVINSSSSEARGLRLIEDSLLDNAEIIASWFRPISANVILTIIHNTIILATDQGIWTASQPLRALRNVGVLNCDPVE